MSEKCENYPVGIVDRLREFMESEARSCSMDPGCITPEYVYRMWCKILHSLLPKSLHF